MQLIVNYNRSALFIYALYKNNYKINISFINTNLTIIINIYFK